MVAIGRGQRRANLTSSDGGHMATAGQIEQDVGLAGGGNGHGQIGKREEEEEGGCNSPLF